MARNFSNNAILLYLISVVNVSFAQEMRDVKDPVNLPPNYFLLKVLGVLLFISLISSAVYLFIRMKKNKKEEVVIRKLPWEIAFEQLELLLKQDLISKGNYKLFYSNLSDIVRIYIESQFKIRAPEMTTEEFLFSLKDSSDLTQVQKAALKEFLVSCDMVKFAKYIPEKTESDNSFILAKKFIEETRSKEENDQLVK